MVGLLLVFLGCGVVLGMELATGNQNGGILSGHDIVLNTNTVWLIGVVCTLIGAICSIVPAMQRKRLRE